MIRIKRYAGLKSSSNVNEANLAWDERMLRDDEIRKQDREHLALIYCPDQLLRQRGKVTTDKQRTKFEDYTGFALST